MTNSTIYAIVWCSIVLGTQNKTKRKGKKKKMIASLFIIILLIPPSLYSRSLPLYFKRHRGHRVPPGWPIEASTITRVDAPDHSGGTVSEHRICNRLPILLNRIYSLSVTTLHHAVRATASSPQTSMIGARFVASSWCIAFQSPYIPRVYDGIGRAEKKKLID